MFTNQNATYRQSGSSTMYQSTYAASPGSPPMYSQSYHNRNTQDQQSYSEMGQMQGAYKTQPLLYPFKDGNFDILYSEEGDGEILIETLAPEEGGQLRLITCVDISTLYKEKRNKAIEIAKEYSKLQHPNILSMTSDFELLDNNGTLMFYTEAPDHIAGWKSYCKKKFTTDEMLCIFRQLCEALAYVHEQGLIHRDVHPTRIHSTFGIAKFNMIGMPYNYKKLLKKDNFCGHVNYSAPELIQEKLTFSPKVDIWSLGCCLYYLCTKKDPFEGRNPQEIKQNIMMGRLERYPSKFDPILRTLINKCLEKDENKRLNAREMLEFQNTIEIEIYGEVRSSIMLKNIMDQYNQISGNPLVHKQNSSDSHQGTEYYEKGYYGVDDRYNNPHFFQNSRYPYQVSNQQKTAVEENSQERFDNGNSSIACQSPQTMSHRELSQASKSQHHALYNYSQSNISQGLKQAYYQKQQSAILSVPTENYLENGSQSNFQNKKATFHQDFKNYQQIQGGESNVSQFARDSISQNFQNNMNQYYQKQQQTFQQYIQGAPSLQQVIVPQGKQQEKQTDQQHLQKQEDQSNNLQSTKVSGPILQQFPPFNVSQPNRSAQPQKIVLPKQEQMQRQIKQYQDKVDPPLPPMNKDLEERKFTLCSDANETNQISDKLQSYQRFDLTQSNLDIFNSQNRSNVKSQQLQKQVIFEPDCNKNSNLQNLVKDELQQKVENVNSKIEFKQDPHLNKSTECNVKGSAEEESGGIPYSIFNTECIFATPKNESSADDLNSDILKDAVLQQEDNPSSGESRNELNKDEIEGIVAQMVESSKRVKNQLHYFDGTKYVGEVMRHGRGIYYDQDGSIYDGDWYEDQRSGKGKILFPDGSVYDGQWEADKIHGKGIYLSSNGDRYEGFFNLGMKEGFGAMYYRNGNTYQGQWHNDQLCGKGVFHFKNGNYYEGSFVSGNFEGIGLMFFVGIGTYKGSFNQGNLEGLGRFEYLNGSVYDGDWKENRKHGRGQLIESDGRSIYTGEWENDYKHGKGTFLQKGAYFIEGVWNKGSLVEMTKFTNYILHEHPHLLQ